jgi:glycosyltransferase involved in cell wall biosynthesis
MSRPKYSVVVPVYNRPQEVAELLESLTHQTYKNFEVVLVEDGSSIKSEQVFEQYASKLSIQYFYKPNTGPGPSRNAGFERARGDYFVVFDSDCIIPPHYFEAVEKYLSNNKVDAWGGPDKGMKDFTPLQQAMAFTMSSVLTTGGIRGKSEKGFQPRSFNMGISREVYEKTKGFQFDRFAEDIELSVRIRKLGFKSALIPDAFVYHKRRTTLSQFYRQVSNFGKGRVLVGKAHPGEVKPTHWFPFFFLLGILSIPVLGLINPLISGILSFCYLTYTILVLFECLNTTRSVWVSLLSIPSLYVQMVGYGSGFIKAMFFKS